MTRQAATSATTSRAARTDWKKAYQEAEARYRTAQERYTAAQERYAKAEERNREFEKTLLLLENLVPVPHTAEDLGLTERQHDALVGWLGGDKKALRRLYKASADGWSYGNFLRCVGNVTGFGILIHKGEYIFGCHINDRIRQPKDSSSWEWYQCPVSWFSLAGHYDQPTRLRDFEKHNIFVAGKYGSVDGKARLLLKQCGAFIDFKLGRDNYLDKCYLWLPSSALLAGYRGKMSPYMTALLAGDTEFDCGELQVFRAY